MINPQRTLRRRAEYSGTGLHTGAQAEIAFLPAPPNHGLIFRVAGPQGMTDIPALVEHVPSGHGGARNTTLAAGGAQVQTVEHVLAALSGLGVSNCLIELRGPEPPEPPDGSVLPYVELLEQAGLEDQGLPGAYYRVPGTIRLRHGGATLTAQPAAGTRLTFEIAFEDPLIGRQRASFEMTPDIFKHELAPCRTFVLKRDVARLQAAGLAKGGTLRNTLVVENGALLGGTPLRFPDEFVRHKLLDLIGDLALLGMPIQGHVTAERSGHDSHVAFVRHLARRERRLPRVFNPRQAVHWDVAAIREIMPHRYPFLLVDRIIELVPGQRVVGLKNVTINEPFFQGHFPDHPIMPAVLIIEAMAQTGGVLLLNSVDDPAGTLVFFSGIDQARFRRPVTPGDQLRLCLQLVKLRGSLCKMRGEAFVDGELVAEAELMSTLVER